METDTTESLSNLSRRNSAFTEIGLEGHDALIDDKIRERPTLAVRFRSDLSIVEPQVIESDPETPGLAPSAPTSVPRKSFLSQIPLAQLVLLIALVAIAFPTFNGPASDSNLMPIIAEASPMFPEARDVGVPSLPAKRQTSSDVCKRWAGQSALVNGTVYYYGGRATTSADQTQGTWSR